MKKQSLQNGHLFSPLNRVDRSSALRAGRPAGSSHLARTVLGVTAAMVMMVGTAACSGQPASQTPVAPSSSAAPGASSTPPKTGGTTSKDPIFGKVSSLVGNELTLDLANPPEGFDPAQMPAGAPGAAPGGAPGGDAPGGDDGGVMVQAAPPAEGGDSSGGSNGSAGDIKYIDDDGAMHSQGDDKMSLDYTGATKDLTVPAGVPIFNLLGKTLKVSDLKEGNVLMIMFDAQGKITSIKVME
ncbi:MAG: hypothetical protein LBV00_03515 [Propionibacteriaceae bacterium]|jgi:hypothetical protein|nr:hypothetical protein [Propionibacteriaceae bacterium]